jgi:ATP-dependent Lon protease
LLSLPINDKGLDVYCSSKDNDKARGIVKDTGKFIHIHPVSQCMYKCIDDKIMAQIIDYCELELKTKVVLTAAPVDQELARVANILKYTKSKPIDLSGNLTLLETTALNKLAQMLIVVDTAIMHIATANDVGRIPAPLRDRMEFISVSSYTPQEKFQIASRYLIPQELKKHGLRKGEVSISKPALKELIHSYTREAGVRNLRRRLANMARKVAREILENPETTKVSLTLKNLKQYFDKTVFEIEKTTKVPVVGVVHGLAWTAVGGDVLKIESIRIKGKGSMQLTGSLGDVMKESARIAYSVVKTLIDTNKLKIDIDNIPVTSKEKEENVKIDSSEVYKRYDLHIHVPDGATPKDGPSAGIAMVSVIASILSSKKIRSEVAMTGEVSLSGDVLPIGGLREKLIAAHKADMSKVLIPVKNYERDLEDIPKEVRDALEIVPVKRVEEVLKHILV